MAKPKDPKSVPIVGTADNMRAVYDRFATHDANAESLGSASEIDSAASKIRNFFAALPTGAHVLDVGPGRGDESKTAQTLGLNVTGLDLSEKMQQLYKRNVPGAGTILGDMTAIDDKYAGKFEAVFCSFSFLHLPREKGILALQQFSKVLKPSGKLFLLTLIGEGVGDMNSGREFLSEAGIESWYFYHWKLADLIAQLEKLKFQVSKQDVFQPIPGRPAAVAIEATFGTRAR